LPVGIIAENIRAMSSRDLEQGIGAATYTIVGSFIGGAAGGVWLGLVLMSIADLYGNFALWEDLLAGAVAGTVVLALAILCGRTAGRLPGLRVVLVAAVAALNVVIVLYLFGDWICQVSLAGPAFTECRRGIVKCCGSAPGHAATLASAPSTSSPFLNSAPALILQL
jgi:hypothetical protein